MYLHAGVEAEAAALADDIAYNSHDMDDGLCAGLYDIEAVENAVPFVGRIVSEVRGKYPDLETNRLIHETTRRVITLLVEDAVAESIRRIDALDPRSADDVRAAAGQVVAFSEDKTSALRDLRGFLFARMYRHHRINSVMADAEDVVARLFAEFIAHPDRMPAEWAHACEATDQARRARIVGDYIAGMTDRFALVEHPRLFDEAPELR